MGDLLGKVHRTCRDDPQPPQKETQQETNRIIINNVANRRR